MERYWRRYIVLLVLFVAFCIGTLFVIRMRVSGNEPFGWVLIGLLVKASKFGFMFLLFRIAGTESLKRSLLFSLVGPLLILPVAYVTFHQLYKDDPKWEFAWWLMVWFGAYTFVVFALDKLRPFKKEVKAETLN